MSKVPEKLLLYRLTNKKDPESFGQLYDLYVEKIYRFIYFKVGNREEAEDITSEVFLKVWNHINEDREIKSFSGLVYRVARNSVIDLYRSKTREVENLDPDKEVVDEKNKWFEKLSIKSETEQVLIALEKLKHDYKEVLTLRYIDELEINEIAEIMDKKNTAVRVLIHRALKRAQQVLEE